MLATSDWSLSLWKTFSRSWIFDNAPSRCNNVAKNIWMIVPTWKDKSSSFRLFLKFYTDCGSRTNISDNICLAYFSKIKPHSQLLSLFNADKSEIRVLKVLRLVNSIIWISMRAMKAVFTKMRLIWCWFYPNDTKLKIVKSRKTWGKGFQNESEQLGIETVFNASIMKFY